MGVGSVLYMVGTSKLTELGGLYKTMPRTMMYTIIGGLSISAFPLFSGFVSKSMTVAAFGEEHLTWAFLLLMLASAGTFLHTGLTDYNHRKNSVWYLRPLKVLKTILNS